MPQSYTRSEMSSWFAKPNQKSILKETRTETNWCNIDCCCFEFTFLQPAMEKVQICSIWQ